MTKNVNRRTFLSTAAALSASITSVPRHVLGGSSSVSPSNKLVLAHIAMGTQSIRELGSLLADPHIQIVSVCDPNKDTNDYVEWGKNSIRNTVRELLGNSSWRKGESGCPGGRDIGREIVNTYYAKQRKSEHFKGCSSYSDFRELLEEEKDFDAVKVMTPDHLHAAVSIAAMKKGKHVLMHKPVANRLYEGRLVVKTERQTGKVTHLLAYGSGTGNGRIAERVKQGVIGPLREIHNWTNRPVWPQYSEIPKDRPPVPKGFDWNLWLGPALDRPYHPHYTHTVFRGWYDFGGGSMADMGIYSLWPVFEVLNLQVPVSAEAWATHRCSIENNVSRTIKNDFSYPTACTLRFRFAGRKNMPELDLFWYDGGMKPRLPGTVEAHNVRMGKEGILFAGENGAIMAGFHGENPVLFKNGRKQPLSVKGTPYTNATHGPSYKPWLRACQEGTSSPGSFQNAASITDTVNLGTVALRAGGKVLFDSKKMRITNPSAANKYLYRRYREGWEL